MEKQFHVYMMSNKAGGMLYVGVTSRLIDRAYEHRMGLVAGFTREYGLTRLVWFEPHGTAESAITREKLVKKWRRASEIQLVEDENPHWVDLSPGLRLGD